MKIIIDFWAGIGIEDPPFIVALKEKEELVFTIVKT